MKRLEYKCSQNEQLLVLGNFIMANTIYCGEQGNVDIIKISATDAADFAELYNQKCLETDTAIKDNFNKVKTEMLEFLILRGYDINNKVEPIIHE